MQNEKLIIYCSFCCSCCCVAFVTRFQSKQTILLILLPYMQSANSTMLFYLYSST